MVFFGRKIMGQGLCHSLWISGVSESIKSVPNENYPQCQLFGAMLRKKTIPLQLSDAITHVFACSVTTMCVLGFALLGFVIMRVDGVLRCGCRSR